MADTWDQTSTSLPKEFLVSAELYISTAAATALRKPTAQRKKHDKRDASSPSTIHLIEENAKVKEKSSWLSLARGPAGTGHWRSATCKLSEEGERCLLNIYVDESILYQTVYVHLLNQTDIRQIDSSLFFRKDCLGIYCIADQRWTSFHTAEPVYLQFPTPDAYNTWLALLKSYAIPEIYGRSFYLPDGGSYRMWRQVEVTIIQGRNLGFTRSFEAVGVEPNSEPDAIDLDISCEIHLNDITCGRTTVKKGIGSPDWHENFTFTDLPPFEALEFVIWREKKLFKPAILGSVRIVLSNFRRGDAVEGWFPVLHGGLNANDLQVGELRLKIRVDEEIILPHSQYSNLLKTFNSRNFLDWMSDFESKLKLKSIAHDLLALALANNVLVKQVQELASREVDGTPSSHQTLFRGNTIMTKVMELCMAWYGKSFLEASIGNVLRRLCAEKVAIEVDPLRSRKSQKDVERNVEQLIYWCQEFWNQIYSVREECPHEMRLLFKTIRVLVEERYRAEDGSQGSSRELPWQSVSAFCFLRFIVPAILHPHLFGLCPGLPSAPVQRSLTLIAKVIQSLANLNSSVRKEEFMRGVKDFLRDSLPAMIDYILVVSTPVDEKYTGPVSDRHDRLHIVNSLRQRTSTMPVLDREAIPILPDLLDIPRHLAIITSAVIRHSRNSIAKPESDVSKEGGQLDDFCYHCFEIEEQALSRVSQLAARISSGHLRPPTSANWAQTSTSLLNPSLSEQSAFSFVPSGDRWSSSSKSKRPSTAPSEIDPLRRQPPSDAFVPLNFFQTSTSSSGGHLSNDRYDVLAGGFSHQKSPSTDSVPTFGAREIVTPYTSTAVDPETTDDAGKRKKGILRGIWRR